MQKQRYMQAVNNIDKDKIHFAVMAIESAAAKSNMTPTEMRMRLARVDLIRRLLFDQYETMHSQSLIHVAEDVVEALYNWEHKQSL